MNLEDLNEGDIVEAKCTKCGEMHHWKLDMVITSSRVALSCAEGKQTCGLNSQFVYAVDVERVVAND